MLETPKAFMHLQSFVKIVVEIVKGCYNGQSAGTISSASTTVRISEFTAGDGFEQPRSNDTV